MKAFLGITAHWISDDWHMHECVLDFIDISENPHTGAYLATIIAKLLDEFKISNGTLAIVTDNATNNDGLFENMTLDIKQVRCFAHVLNLAVQGIYIYKALICILYCY